MEEKNSEFQQKLNDWLIKAGNFTFRLTQKLLVLLQKFWAWYKAINWPDIPLTAFQWVLLFYTIFGLLFMTATPILEASDELWHFGMVEYLRENDSALPVHDVSDPELIYINNLDTIYRQEGSQPPLYYYTMALLTSTIDISDAELVVEGEFTVLLSDFDIKQPSALGDVVDDDILIKFHIEIESKITRESSDSKLQVYFFLPDQLGVNSYTFTKDMFYQSMVTEQGYFYGNPNLDKSHVQISKLGRIRTDNNDNHNDYWKQVSLLSVQWRKAIKSTFREVIKTEDAFITKGQLTIKDITKNVSIPFTVEDNGDSKILKGDIEIERLDYNLGTDQGSFLVNKTANVTIVCILK